jgi:hypothetical protein
MKNEIFTREDKGKLQLQCTKGHTDKINVFIVTNQLTENKNGPTEKYNKL